MIIRINNYYNILSKRKNFVSIVCPHPSSINEYGEIACEKTFVVTLISICSVIYIFVLFYNCTKFALHLLYCIALCCEWFLSSNMRTFAEVPQTGFVAQQFVTPVSTQHPFRNILTHHRLVIHLYS